MMRSRFESRSVLQSTVSLRESKWQSLMSRWNPPIFLKRDVDIERATSYFRSATLAMQDRSRLLADKVEHAPWHCGRRLLTWVLHV